MIHSLALSHLLMTFKLMIFRIKSYGIPYVLRTFAL